MIRKSAKAKRATIPKTATSLDAVYDILARDLALPAHFGRNLDALYDCLTGDMPGPFEIVVEDGKALEKSLGAKGKALTSLLRDVGRSRKDAIITVAARRSRKAT